MLVIEEFKSAGSGAEGMTFEVKGRGEAADVPTGIKKRFKVKGGKFTAKFAYSDLGDFEGAFQGQSYGLAEGIEVSEADQQFLTYIWDAPQPVDAAPSDDDAAETEAAPEAADEVVIVQDDEPEQSADVEPREALRSELVGRGLVQLRKRAAAHGVAIKGLSKEALIDAILAAELGGGEQSEPAPEPAPEPKKKGSRRKASGEAPPEQPKAEQSTDDPQLAVIDGEPEPEAATASEPSASKKGKAKQTEPETVLQSRADELGAMTVKALKDLASEEGYTLADMKGLKKEGLIALLLGAGEDAPEAAPEPEQAPKKGKGATTEDTAKGAADDISGLSYKELQKRAAELGHHSVGVKKAELIELINSGPAAGSTEAPQATPEGAAKAKKRGGRPRKSEAAPKAPEPSKREQQTANAVPILEELTPIVRRLVQAFGGSEHKARIALSSLVGGLDIVKREGNAVIGFPAGKTLKITKTHRGLGECSYTIKFGTDGRSMALVGFTGEAGGRTLGYPKGIVAAAKAGAEFPNFNQLMRLITSREYPRITWAKFIESAEVEEL